MNEQNKKSFITKVNERWKKSPKVGKAAVIILVLIVLIVSINNNSSTKKADEPVTIKASAPTTEIVKSEDKKQDYNKKPEELTDEQLTKKVYKNIDETFGPNNILHAKKPDWLKLVIDFQYKQGNLHARTYLNRNDEGVKDIAKIEASRLWLWFVSSNTLPNTTWVLVEDDNGDVLGQANSQKYN